MKRADSWRDNEQHPSEIELDEYEKNERFDKCFNSGVLSVDSIVTLIHAQIDKNVWIEKRGIKNAKNI